MKVFVIFCMSIFLNIPSVIAQNYLNSGNPKLTEDQKKASKLSSKFIKSSNYPILGEDGSIVYLYNSGLPSILCKPFMACTIDLELGEVVNQIHLGDKNRWHVSPVISGLRSHIVVKPRDVNIRTILLIFTDRRKYTIELVAHKSKFNPSITFVYPDSADTQWQDYMYNVQANKKINTPPPVIIKESKIETMDFAYTVKGNAPWKPKRVFNDGIKTKIQMPKEIQHYDIPALLVLDRAGQERIVNYSFQGDSYIVDHLFDKAILISGVGKSQEKIIITRDNATK